MISKDIENNKNKNGVKDGNLLEKLILRIDRLELDVIKSKFQIIDIELKLIKTQEWIVYENIINSEYINIGKKRIQYLENLNKSLENVVINLSNPCTSHRE